MSDEPAELATLPFSKEHIPESLRRFCGADAPGPARGMAAKGLVPVKGPDLLFVLTQLAHDQDASIAESAKKTLGTMPIQVIEPGCAALSVPEVIDFIAHEHAERQALWTTLATNTHIANVTLAFIAGFADDQLCERIALNEQRLLSAPEVIAALYKNRNTRMSTADRIVELATRNGLHVEGVPAFNLHAEALEGQLIPEPSDEPLPSDVQFQETLEKDSDDPHVTEVDPNDEDKENLKEKHKPLAAMIADMNKAEKVRLATIGNASARAILVRDHNKIVAVAAISSPRTTEHDALSVAGSKQVIEDVLRIIGNKREWLRSYELKRTLIFNPKTPLGITMGLLSHMRVTDLQMITKSKNVNAALKKMAQQMLAKRQPAKDK